jgi:hypothetical protein
MTWPSPLEDLPAISALQAASAAFVHPSLPQGFRFRSVLLPGVRPPPPVLNGARERERECVCVFVRERETDK